MRSQPLSPEDKKALLDLAKQWGKIVARRAFGPDGPEIDVNFATMEDLATEAAQAMQVGTLEEMLRQQAGRFGVQHPCPQCGTLCPVEPEGRSVIVRGGGAVDHQEPSCDCRKCRRSFFPSASGVGAGSSRVQSLGADEDRDGRGGA